MMDLSPTHNWCDRRCERCLLNDNCPVAVHEKTRRQTLELRGEDPDDWDVVLAGMQEDLAGAVELLEAAAVEEGVDPSMPHQSPPACLPARRLRAAGARYLESAAAVSRVAPGEDVDALRSCVLVTTMKLARLASHLEIADDDILEYDVAPNRLLLERVDQDARQALHGIAARFPGDPVERCDSERQNIVALLDREFGPVSESVRAGLAELTAAGRAPSPFCVRQSSSAEGHRR